VVRGAVAEAEKAAGLMVRHAAFHAICLFSSYGPARISPTEFRLNPGFAKKPVTKQVMFPDLLKIFRLS
jgi:hypothetical protein